MPRSTFGISALDSATPGLSRLAAAFAGGDQAYDGGFDKGLSTQSKIMQAMAAVNASNATADYHRAEAGQVGAKTNILTGRPAALDEALAAQTGSTIPMVQAFRDQLRTGQQTMKPAMGPAEEDGTQATQFPVLDSGSFTNIGKAFARQAPMRTNVGDTTPESLAKATGAYRDQDNSDAIIAGTLDRNKVAGAEAAAGGKPLYHFGENGVVGDLFGGGINETGGLARGNIALAGAKTKAEVATAADRYASAGAHKASADKTRQEIEQGVKTGNLKLEKDADGNIVVVDLAKRTVQPATDPTTGLPVKTATKGTTLNADQAKANIYGSRMAEADRVLASLAEQGVDRPSVIKQGVETLPIIGGVGGMVANSLPSVLGGASPKQQQVEQAQRDFVNAVLRRESGAAIATSEFDSARKQYFPQVGDAPEVVAQKARNRDLAIRGMMAEVPQAMRLDGPGGTPGVRPPRAALPEAPAKSALSVQTPDGQTHTFPNPAALVAFKKAAGLP